jgi:hypothetical protein
LFLKTKATRLWLAGIEITNRIEINCDAANEQGIKNGRLIVEET